MSSLLSIPRNYSLYAIPAAWLISFFPHAYAVYLHDSKSPQEKFDNTSPRVLTKKVDQNQSLDQATKDKIVRAEGAQQNGFENLGLFASAVVAGNMANLGAGVLNGLSAAYLVSRVVYNTIYINNRSAGWAMGRSCVFVGGVGVCMVFFVLAGNKLVELSLP